MSRPERFYFSLYHPDAIILCAVTINLNLCWDLQGPEEPKGPEQQHRN
jgi:hypothetical protein